VSVLYLEGFEGYNNTTLHLTREWSTAYYSSTEPQVTTAAGRAGNGLRLESGAHVHKVIPDRQTVIVGFSFRANTISTPKRVCFFRDEETMQIYLELAPSGLLYIKRGDGTILGISTNTYAIGQFYYIEFKIKISNTVGSFELRTKRSRGAVGVEATATNIDTQFSNNARINVVGFGGGTAGEGPNAFDYDDIVILDDQGSYANDFLGPKAVDVIFPNGIGTYTTWNPIGVSPGWEAVNDTAPDDDSTYVTTSATARGTETYQYQNVRGTTIGGIVALAISTLARKEYGNTAAIRNALLPGTIDGYGGTVRIASEPMYLQTDYAYHTDIFEKNPSGDAVWTPLAVNALEGGYIVHKP